MGYGTVDDFETKPSILLYGDNGCGKTWLMGTNKFVPECQPSFLIDADLGEETIRSMFREDKTGKIHSPQARYTFDSEHKILKHIPIVLKKIKEGGFKTVFLDTISTFTFNLLDEIAGGGAVQRQHWNQLFRETLSFVKAIKRECDIFIATSFPTFIYDSDGNVTGVTPLIQGNKFPTMLMNEFNTIAFYSVKNIKSATGDTQNRLLKAQANGFSIARDRFNLIGELKNPTFADIYYKIFPKEKN